MAKNTEQTSLVEFSIEDVGKDSARNVKEILDIPIKIKADTIAFFDAENEDGESYDFVVFEAEIYAEKTDKDPMMEDKLISSGKVIVQKLRNAVRNIAKDKGNLTNTKIKAVIYETNDGYLDMKGW